MLSCGGFRTRIAVRQIRQTRQIRHAGRNCFPPHGIETDYLPHHRKSVRSGTDGSTLVAAIDEGAADSDAAAVTRPRRTKHESYLESGLLPEPWT